MIDLFLPKRCLQCDAPARSERRTPLASHLCSVCLRQFETLEEPDANELEEKLGRHPSIPKPVFSVASYPFRNGDVTQALVHAVKYTGMPRLGRTLGRMISEGRQKELEQFDVLIPVPLHRTKLAERGFNQAEALAKGIRDICNSKVITTPKQIRRIRPTKSQTTLTLVERAENVRGVFEVTPLGKDIIAGRSVLLIDDVVTTGATLASLAEEVSKSEPVEIGFLVFASADANAKDRQ